VQCSLISSGCNIQGTVVNSVLSPGVVVEKGAIVRNSILFSDCIVKKGAVIDLAILDKRVQVGAGAMIGVGDNLDIPNRQHPTHLYTGITLLGKGVEVPAELSVGRNCIVNSYCRKDAFTIKELCGGESLFPDGEIT
jgi:glucose-1-phosphate adenylyltransferase